MDAVKILKLAGLDPNDSVFSLNYEDALERLSEFIEEWELDIKIKKINKDDWKTIFANYSESIVDYHLENDHQERGAFLRSEKILKKYGLTDEDITRLDFC